MQIYMLILTCHTLAGYIILFSRLGRYLIC